MFLNWTILKMMQKMEKPALINQVLAIQSFASSVIVKLNSKIQNLFPTKKTIISLNSQIIISDIELNFSKLTSDVETLKVLLKATTDVNESLGAKLVGLKNLTTYEWLL